MKKVIEKLKKIPRAYYISGIILFILVLTVAIPSLARYKNRAEILNKTVWSGEAATSYHQGTGSKSDPYVIATGEELAYFSNMLKTTNYSNSYFLLNNSIILNDGTFQYVDDKLTYISEGKTFYIKKYTNELYEDSNLTIKSDKKVNIFPSLENFKGHFDGNSSTIYGLYVSNNESNELGLFTNLNGEVHDLIVRNSLIYGGTITAGIASSSNSATLKNVLYDGKVIGKNTEIKKTHEINIDNQEKADLEVDSTSIIDISSSLVNIDGIITSTTLTGACSSDKTTGKLTINDKEIIECSNSNFSIDLGKNITNKLSVSFKDSSDGTNYKLTNLKYTINYDNALTAGLVAKVSDSTIENAITKGNVSSSALAAGMVAKASNLSIKNSYNNASVNSSNFASGLIGEVSFSNQKKEISKCYNSGNVTASSKAGLIGIFSNNSESITIRDSFDTTDNSIIDIISTSDISINNSYSVNNNKINQGTVNGEVSIASISSIKSNITFNHYNSQKDYLTNPNNIWVLDKTNLPVLFLDDILDSKAIITVGNHSWNNQAIDLDTYYYKDKLTFKIEAKDFTTPLKETYYYISNKELTKTEISNITAWEKYDNITNVTEEGSYIIYVKAIDYNNNIDYLNTDLLVLDNTPPTAEISYSSHLWKKETSEINNVYIDSDISLKSQANDELSKLASISYHLSDKVLSIAELNSLPDSDWEKYTDSISIKDRKITVVYVKALDNAGNTSYVNTDYLVYGGYEQTNMYFGEKDLTTLKDITISNNSSITFTYNFENNSAYKKEYTRNLITNKLLPVGTKITILDTKNNKAYTYEIETAEDNYNYNNSCKDSTDCQKIATYPFTLFKELGTIDSNYIDEEANKIADNYKVILDFKKASITEKISVITIKLQILDEKKNTIYSTLSKTIRKFSIASAPKPSLSIKSSYKDSIVYNSNSTIEIPIESKLNTTIGVYDNYYQNKIVGLIVKMVDSNKNTVPRSYLKNLEFIVGDKNYYPDDNGIIRINLQKETIDFTTSLKIITNKDNVKLKEGNYSIEISSHLAADGMYSKVKSKETISIPVVYEKEYDNLSYNFKVTTNKENKILNKAKDNNIKFSISKTGAENLSTRISLHKKTVHSAYNQKYTMINLKDYTDNSLGTISSNVYSLTSDSLDLHLLTTRLSPGGYKLLFELYANDKKVGEVPYKFIVK